MMYNHLQFELYTVVNPILMCHGPMSSCLLGPSKFMDTEFLIYKDIEFE